MIEFFFVNEGTIQGALVAALLAYSLQIALRAGVFSFAGIGFYGIAAYAAGVLQTDHGWGVVAVLLVSLAGTAVLAVVLALVLARLRALYLAMATLALVLLVQTVAEGWDEVTGGALGLFGIPPLLGTVEVTLLVLAVLVPAALTQRGRTGRWLLIMRRDETLAGALGVDVLRHRTAAFTASALVGAVAGVVQANLLTVFTPENVGFGVLVSSLTVLVVGGVWHWSGPLIGAFVVAWLPLWLAEIGEWRVVVEGVATVLVVVFLPAGIAGLLVSARHAVAARRTARRATPDPDEAPVPTGAGAR